MIEEFNSVNNVLMASDISAHHPLWKTDIKMVAESPLLIFWIYKIFDNNGDYTYTLKGKKNAVHECEWEKSINYQIPSSSAKINY